MRIAIFIPENILVNELPIIKKRFQHIKIDFIFYPSIYKIPHILSGSQKKYNALLFLGRTTMNYVASKLTPTIPWYIVPRSNATLLQLLFKISLTDFNLYNIITDMPESELNIVANAYHEANLPIENLNITKSPHYQFDELFYENLSDFYTQYLKSKAHTCITIYSDVYQKLRAKGYNIFFLYTSLPDICNTIEKAHSEFLLHASRESQLIILHISVDELNAYSPLKKDEYQIALENLSVAKYIYIFAQKIQGAIFTVKETEYLIIATRKTVENKTNKFKNISLISNIHKNTARTISIGAGFGRTALEAKNHAKIGLKKAKNNGGNRIFLVYDEKTIRNPVTEISAIEPIINDHFIEVSKKTGISSFTLSQIHKLLTEKGSQECTVPELSDYLSISQRAVNRLIIKLLDTNYCFEVGKHFHDKAGRPSRILKITI